MIANTVLLRQKADDGGSTRTQFDERSTMCAGHIVHVSAAHDAGTLRLDSGEMVEFKIAEAAEGDAKHLHVGDHAWVTAKQSVLTKRMLLCPTRNKMLRVVLAE